MPTRLLKRLALAALCVPALTCHLVLARESFTQEQIDQAIDRGVQHLLSTQQASGGWGDYGSGDDLFRHGYDVCGLMGLAYGELPVNDDRLKKALDLVLKVEVDRNYVYAVRVIALSKLYGRLGREQKELVLKRLESDVTWIVKAQDAAGGDWDYYGTGKGELSNTQMALLALSEASNILELRPEVWQKALKRYLEIQRDDGGWNYGSRSQVHAVKPSYGSMSAAAVASLFIIRDKLYRGTGCPCKGGRSPRKGLEVDRAIDRGIDWLKANFVVDKNPGRGGWFYYWPFSCERVGLASGIKYFGTHDWYSEMTAHILGRQAPDGGWGQTSNTALMIAFLVKGRAPILANKLQFKGQWNNHPRDLANLARYLGHQKEQAIQWQVINLEVPVEEMHDAPILYITAETIPAFTDEQKQKLRRFTDTGGTILFEASCGNRKIITWWTQVCKELWPEWELKHIDKEHGLWQADKPMKGRLPSLLGISDGLRTAVFFSKTDLSCPWNVQALTRNRTLFDLGGNLYMYATDRAKLRSRLASRPTVAGKKYSGQTPAKGDKDTLTVARIKHGGEWFLGRNYSPWQILGANLKEKVGLTITELEPVALGADLPQGVDLLYLCGRKGCDLDAAGTAWLKKRLAGGALLFAEATLGDKQFEPALRKALASAGLTLRPLPDDSPLVTGQFGGPAGYNVSRVGYTFSLRSERIGKASPSLLGIYDGERMVGVFSPFDIMFSQTGCRAFGNRGYAAEDARALAVNIALMGSR